jgi:hypothetical protein
VQLQDARLAHPAKPEGVHLAGRERRVGDDDAVPAVRVAPGASRTSVSKPVTAVGAECLDGGGSGVHQAVRASCATVPAGERSDRCCRRRCGGSSSVTTTGIKNRRDPVSHAILAATGPPARANWTSTTTGKSWAAARHDTLATGALLRRRPAGEGDGTLAEAAGQRGRSRACSRSTSGAGRSASAVDDSRGTPVEGHAAVAGAAAS